jgi:probable H4MPT-linked C1 transfer pathway protein
MPRSFLGLDVGGANLKAAHTGGGARAIPFALWNDLSGLPAALAELAADLPEADAVAVTMTGELCDCFESKSDGVRAILDAVASAAGPKPVRVWDHDGLFVQLERARSEPLKVASANWLALATFTGRFAPDGNALLIDIGTTTTDIVPLVDGHPRPQGRTDPERLECGELVYRGWRRTPLCALAGPSRAAEFFATMHDAYLVMKVVPEEPASRDTADGRTATRANAGRRLARMLCCDLETTTARQCQQLAEEMNFRLCTQIAHAASDVLKRLPGPVGAIVSSGSGEFLIRGVLASALLPPDHDRWPIVSLGERLGRGVSTAACAYAVATLCQEREG